MPESEIVSSAEVHAKALDGSVLVERRFGDAPLAELLAAGPWRTFRWYRRQKHYSGFFWSATEGAHVIYESRLELARLLYADFDRSVSRIIAQPFLMTTLLEGAVRRHVPDFLLKTDSGPLVVDVKPAQRLERPVVAFTFNWTRRVIESRGWRYEVWSEPSPVHLENLRFLAGYRRSCLFAAEIMDALDAAVPDEATLQEAFEAVTQFEPRVVRATVLHMVWSGRVVTDLDVRLGLGSVLRRST